MGLLWHEQTFIFSVRYLAIGYLALGDTVIMLGNYFV